MDLSVVGYLILLALVGLSRQAELAISRRHQRELLARGIEKRADPQFRWMVVLHAGVLTGAAIEVVALRRPFLPRLAVPMAILFLCATALRWWVIRTLGAHWNVEVMASAPLGVVTSGPFRWVRHPNYLAVFVELVALPLVHTAWITALVAAAGNAWVLRHRLRVEEPVLEADAAYRTAMAGKPRFLPGLF
jgi:methyltransferase